VRRAHHASHFGAHDAPTEVSKSFATAKKTAAGRLFYFWYSLGWSRLEQAALQQHLQVSAPVCD
jgi:hypothetical protein